MDSLTHVVLGGCIGQVIAGKTLGRKAVWLGIVGQSIPDIDFVAGLWMDESDHILAHRGFTHSIVFGLLATFALAWFFNKVFHMHGLRLRKYIWLFAINIFVHVLLDTCNAYGTAFFQPFSDMRFSFHLLFVADPLFSIAPFFAFCWLLLSRYKWNVKKKIAWAGLSVSALYIVVASFNKWSVTKTLRAQLENEKIYAAQQIVTPTLFNTVLWYIVLVQDDGCQVGYRSIFDTSPHIEFKFFPRRDSLVKEASNKDAARDLIKFAEGAYTFELWHDTLVMNTLRFGQVGWQDSSNRFAFYYYLNKPEGNKLVIQRGRFEGMDRKGWERFWRRIRGR
ncbi:MAG: metal-dependent hydrolase [Agriterribacter sp.]